MKLFSIVLLVTSLFGSYAIAETDDVKKLRLALAKSMPQVEPSKISPSPITGMYEVIVGTQVVYMSVDAQFMIDGDLINLNTNENVSEGAKSSIRLSAINKLGVDNMLVYSPKKVKDTITVITDIDCPYCRRLHDEVPEYLENNVEVRYIFMPLKGAADMKKTVSVWCSDDRQAALTTAKSGGKVDAKTCDNPIKDHLQLAREIGVRGTPAIVLEDGQMLPGYVPSAKLIAELRK